MSEQPEDSVGWGEALEKLARELYAFRYAPVPTSADLVELYKSAMDLRRGMWDTEDVKRREVWFALAGDMLDAMFEGES